MKLDHFVLTVQSVDKTIAFYRDALDIHAFRFGEGRWALSIGDQKINLHQAGNELTPHAHAPTPGSADFCLITDKPIEAWLSDLKAKNIAVEMGPVARTGATGPLTSIYIRDPDQNLVEIANSVSE